MRILKPGDPCPCCGRPIPDNTAPAAMMVLSYIQYGMDLRRALKGVTEDEQQSYPDRLDAR